MGFFVSFCVILSMRFTKYIVLAAVAAAVLHADEPASLSLDGAFAAVEHANLSVLLSREAEVQAIETANQQRAGILPRIALDAQQKRQLTVGGQNTALAGTLVQTGASNRFDGQLTASYSLLDASLIEGYRAARPGVKGAHLDYQAALQTALAGVAQAFFSHLRDAHRIGVLDSNIGRAKSLLELAQSQLHAGVATQIDVTRAEAALAT